MKGMQQPQKGMQRKNRNLRKFFREVWNAYIEDTSRYSEVYLFKVYPYFVMMQIHLELGVIYNLATKSFHDLYLMS